MDRTDINILRLLQRDASLSTAHIAGEVGLTTTPCWRRIQHLEQRGVIKKRVALLDRNSLNVGTDAFVAVRAKKHSEGWFARFATAVSAFPEVIELYRLSGQTDYLMRVVVPDIDAFDTFYRRLIKAVDLSDVSTSFAMERIKYTTELPLAYFKRD